MPNDQPSLRVDGEVATPRTFQAADLRAIDDADQVRDVSEYQPGRRGVAARLDALLRAVEPHSDAGYLCLHADADDFHVTIPLAAVRGQSVVIYEVEGRAPAADEGGPFRFLILNPTACQTSDLDDCANVKHLDRIEIRNQPGRDTRPRDEAAHAALHARQGLSPRASGSSDPTN